MTKTDEHLIDYLAECFQISPQEFDTNMFLVYTLTHMYKKHGKACLVLIRKRTTQ